MLKSLGQQVDTRYVEMCLLDCLKNRVGKRGLMAETGMTVIEAVVALSILGLVGSGFAVGMNQRRTIVFDSRPPTSPNANSRSRATGSSTLTRTGSWGP